MRFAATWRGVAESDHTSPRSSIVSRSSSQAPSISPWAIRERRRHQRRAAGAHAVATAIKPQAISRTHRQRSGLSGAGLVGSRVRSTGLRLGVLSRVNSWSRRFPALLAAGRPDELGWSTTAWGMDQLGTLTPLPSTEARGVGSNRTHCPRKSSGQAWA